MNDPVKTLMKQSISTARKFRSLDRQLTKLIDQCQRTDWNDPARKQLEDQKEALGAKMRALSGAL